MRTPRARFVIRLGEMVFVAAISTGVAGTAAAQGSGLVAAYAFGEGSGATVADASGNGNQGSISGATWTSAGRYGAGLSFDGSNDVVVVPDSSSLDLSTGMTLEAWVYPTSSLSNWKAIMQKEVDAWFLNANTSGNHAGTGGTLGGVCCSILDGPSALAVNQWTHVAGTYDGAMLRLYLNGTQVASQPATGTLQVNSLPLRIGGNTYGSEFFPGRIDEVRIYNRALSASEIQTDMNTAIGQGSPPPPPPPPAPSPDPGITLMWQQPPDSAPVNEFRVYKGPALDQGTRIYTGLPVPAQGVYATDVQIDEIAEGIPVYVWLTAANSAGESAPSNPKVYPEGCDPLTDADCDRILDVPNAPPCATAQTVGCDDNCPYWPNPGQEDRGGTGVGPPDGIGDACQCGDVSGDGRITSVDSLMIKYSLVTPPRAVLPRPDLCDVGGSVGCTGVDSLIVKRAQSRLSGVQPQQQCAPALMP